MSSRCRASWRASPYPARDGSSPSSRGREHPADHLRGATARPGGACDRGDAPRQGFHGRQAGAHDLRATRCRPTGAGGDRADLLGRFHRAVRGAGDDARGAIGRRRSDRTGDPYGRSRSASAEPAAASGLVLSPRRPWRDPGRYRVAQIRPVPVLHRFHGCLDRCRPGRKHGPSRRPRVRGSGRGDAAQISGFGLFPRGLVHARRPADLGRREAHHASAPRAISNCANTSTSPADRVSTICSWSTGRACGTSIAPIAICPVAAACAPTSSTARRPRCRRPIASRSANWRCGPRTSHPGGARFRAWRADRRVLAVDSQDGFVYKRAVSLTRRAQVAQLVEHATENRSVAGSIPALGTIFLACADPPPEDGYGECEHRPGDT